MRNLRPRIEEAARDVGNCKVKLSQGHGAAQKYAELRGGVLGEVYGKYRGRKSIEE